MQPQDIFNSSGQEERLRLEAFYCIPCEDPIYCTVLQLLPIQLRKVTTAGTNHQDPIEKLPASHQDRQISNNVLSSRRCDV